jgi:hypothetical protein
MSNISSGTQGPQVMLDIWQQGLHREPGEQGWCPDMCVCVCVCVRTRVCGRGGASVSVLVFAFTIVHYIISCLFV